MLILAHASLFEAKKGKSVTFQHTQRQNYFKFFLSFFFNLKITKLSVNLVLILIKQLRPILRFCKFAIMEDEKL